MWKLIYPLTDILCCKDNRFLLQHAIVQNLRDWIKKGTIAFDTKAKIETFFGEKKNLDVFTSNQWHSWMETLHSWIQIWERKIMMVAEGHDADVHDTCKDYVSRKIRCQQKLDMYKLQRCKWEAIFYDSCQKSHMANSTHSHSNWQPNPAKFWWLLLIIDDHVVINSKKMTNWTALRSWWEHI